MKPKSKLVKVFAKCYYTCLKAQCPVILREKHFSYLHETSLCSGTKFARSIISTSQSLIIPKGKLLQNIFPSFFCIKTLYYFLYYSSNTNKKPIRQNVSTRKTTNACFAGHWGFNFTTATILHDNYHSQ